MNSNEIKYLKSVKVKVQSMLDKELDESHYASLSGIVDEIEIAEERYTHNDEIMNELIEDLMQSKELN